MARLANRRVAPRRTYWVPAVVAPGERNASPCRRVVKPYLIDADDWGPTRGNFPTFDTRGECLEWMMKHRADITRVAPDAVVTPVDLSKWLRGRA